MKIKIINLDERIEVPQKKRNITDKFILASLLVCQIFFNTVLPFTLGYFFFQTNSIIFFLFMLILVFFNIQIEYNKEGEIKIKVVRNV